MVASGRQKAGFHFMLGITPFADDERYGLRAAALQTTPGTFVTPDDTTLEAATALASADATTGTWPIPYSAFQTAAGASAYPGTMIVYAAVPTTGLTAGDASDLASLLRFAVSAGQTPGLGVGQLPPGYLPLTDGNGLGALVAYTTAAADDVAAQNGQVPSMSPSPATSTSAAPATSTASPTTSSTTGTAPPSSPTATPSAGAGTFASTPFPVVRGLSSFVPRLSGGAFTGAANGTATHKAKSDRKPDPRPIWLGNTLDVALWTGGLGKGGALVALILGSSLLIVVLVPPLYLVGRRRGKW